MLGKRHKNLKELTIILRCHLHSAQRSLENALNSESRVAKLVDALVTAASPPQDDRNLGGLVRGLRNSSKLTRGRSPTHASHELGAFPGAA